MYEHAPNSAKVMAVKRQWLALDQNNDRAGKIILMRSLSPYSEEMEALVDLIYGLYFTQGRHHAAYELVVRR